MCSSDRPQDACNTQNTASENKHHSRTYSALYVHQLRAFINAAEDVDVDSDTIEDLLEGLEDVEEQDDTQQSDNDEDEDEDEDFENLTLLVHKQYSPIEDNDLDGLEIETTLIEKLQREGTYVHLISCPFCRFSPFLI